MTAEGDADICHTQFIYTATQTEPATRPFTFLPVLLCTVVRLLRQTQQLPFIIQSWGISLKSRLPFFMSLILRFILKASACGSETSEEWADRLRFTSIRTSNSIAVIPACRRKRPAWTCESIPQS